MPQTGATRYQKFLKSEKAKTKLKSKELPRGTNVTKTNFKVKKIVIKEQLKKHDQREAVTTRKLNVQELISRLSHFNTNSRTDALNGLKELITSHPDVLFQSLGTLLHKITPLVLNIEKVVRQETFKVLHLILTNVAKEKLDPFFNFLSTYLRSAMTHIDNRIQEDSLLFLDILLQCTPEYVSKDFHKILPNFLDMISKLRMDSKPGRTLIVTLDNKNTSVKWRVKVLHRLQQFLQKFVVYNFVQGKYNVTHQFDETKSNHFDLFNVRYISNSHMLCLSSNDSQTSISDESETFLSYVETLMPLLFETWVEVRPSESHQKEIENVLTEDAAILLKHILQLISLIVTHIKFLQKKGLTSNIESKFFNKYKKQFSENILKGFPYHTNIRSSKGQQTNTAQIFEDSITDSKMRIENLEICKLFVVFNPSLNIKAQTKEIKSVLNYLERTINQNTDEGINKIMIKILDDIFSNEQTGWTKNIQIMDSIFKKIVSAYVSNDKASEFLECYFCLLCKISLNDKLTHFHNTEAHSEWLENLPNILLEPSIRTETVNMLHKFCVSRNNIFNEIIKSKQLGIIQNLPNIKISNGESDVMDLTYFKLYSLLFFYVPHWSREPINLLEKQILEQEYSEKHYKYIIDTLKFRMNNTQYLE